MYLSMQKYKSLLTLARSGVNAVNSVNEVVSEPYNYSTSLNTSNSTSDEAQSLDYGCVEPHAFNPTSKNVLVVATAEEEHALFEKFCDNFNSDTIFALRVISQNASSLIVSEIVEHLWSQFKSLNCVYSSETNDYLLKKIVFINE